MINVFQPQLGIDELATVGQVFASNWIGRGKKAEQFEAAFAGHIGVEPAHCLSVTSCTEGLFQAVELLDIGPGDEVIIPTIHFVGAANAVLSRGATPVFCDVDLRTLNARIDDIAAKVTGRTKAVIAMHYGGNPGEIAAIAEMCRGLPPVIAPGGRLRVIEDCACSVASTVNGRACGTLGDIGVWSFDPMKIISTGDGGMLYVKDGELLNRARKQIYLGMDSASGLTGNGNRWWEFTVDYPGRRAQMNDIAAAIGLEQLKKLPGFIKRRRQIAGYYRDRLADFVTAEIEVGSSYYLFWIQVYRRDDLARYLRANGVYTTFRYYPLHLAFKTGERLINAESAAETTLLLPLHPALCDRDVDHICDCVRSFYVHG